MTYDGFVDHLTGKLAQNRAALAALRRGLGQEPGSVPDMLPYVVPFVNENTSEWQERSIYITGSLFGLHPKNTDVGNMGEHMTRLRSSDDTALERRFTSLLAAHPEELDAQLRRTIAFLKSKDVAINWQQLFSDILFWNRENRRNKIRRAWAGSFWKHIDNSEPSKNKEG